MKTHVKGKKKKKKEKKKGGGGGGVGGGGRREKNKKKMLDFEKGESKRKGLFSFFFDVKRDVRF